MNAPATPRPEPRQRVRREQLSDEVAAHLRVGIMSGTLRPGTFIRLDETAAELGVSITPVREALRTLRGEGMVQLEPHRGHVVSPFTRGDIEDIFWLQATIASQLARSAAERITDEEIDELERLAEAVADAIERQDTDDVGRAPSSPSTGRSTGPRAGSSWPGSCCTRPATCRRTSTPTTRSGARDAVANRRELIAALRRRDVDDGGAADQRPVHRRRATAHRPARRAGAVDLSRLSGSLVLPEASCSARFFRLSAR